MAQETLSSSESFEEVDDIATYHCCELPGNGYGTITKDQRALIWEKFGVKAAARKRASWPCKYLTLNGKARGIAGAKILAEGFILESQKRYNASNPGPDTEGAEDDPYKAASGGTVDIRSKAEKRRQKRFNRRAKLLEQREKELKDHQEHAQRLAMNAFQNQMVMQQMMLAGAASSSSSSPMFPLGFFPPPGLNAPGFGATPVKQEASPSIVKQEPIKVKVEPAVRVKDEPGAKLKVKLEPGVKERRASSSDLGATATVTPKQPSIPPPSHMQPKRARFHESTAGDGDVLEETPPTPPMLEILDSDAESDNGIIHFQSASHK